MAVVEEAAIPSVSPGRAAAAWQLVRGSTVLLAASVVASALGIVYTFAAARLLPPDKYGELVALISLAGLLAAPAVTVQTVVARYVAAANDGPPAGRAEARTLGRLLRGMAGVTIALALLLAAAAGPLADYLRLPSTVPTLWMVPLAASILVLPTLRGAVQGLCRFVALAALTTVDILFKAVLGLGLIAAGFGASGAMAAMAVGVLAGVGLTWLSLPPAWRPSARRRPAEAAPGDDAGLAPLLRFFLPTAGVSAGIVGVVLLDTIMARHYLPERAAGDYAAVAVLGRGLFWLSGAVATAIVPLAARRGKGEVGRSVVVAALGVTLAVAACGQLCFYAAPDVLMVRVFGASYASAAPLLPRYGWAAAALALGNVLANYALGRGAARAALPALAAALLFIALVALRHEDAGAIITNLTAAGLVMAAGEAAVVWRTERQRDLPPMGIQP